jgi:hypothetical protein
MLNPRRLAETGIKSETRGRENHMVFLRNNFRTATCDRHRRTASSVVGVERATGPSWRATSPPAHGKTRCFLRDSRPRMPAAGCRWRRASGPFHPNHGGAAVRSRSHRWRYSIRKSILRNAIADSSNTSRLPEPQPPPPPQARRLQIRVFAEPAWSEPDFATLEEALAKDN